MKIKVEIRYKGQLVYTVLQPRSVTSLKEAVQNVRDGITVVPVLMEDGESI
jgi:hypothetical protein